VVKKRHTDKNVLVVDADTHQVRFLSATHPGQDHDKHIVDAAALHFAVGTQLSGDSAFQGYAPAGVLATHLKKAMRGHPLSTLEWIANRLKARVRVLVEHIIASVKRCRIVKDVLRNTKADVSDQVIYLACGLHNLRTDCRWLRSPRFQLRHYFR
jgi:hypothetical protein